MFEIFTRYFGAEVVKLSENDSVTNILCFSGYLISVATTQPYHCSLEEHRNMETNECDSVAIKFYLQKQAEDQIRPTGHGLPTPILEQPYM